jgi:hypothetical protein
MGKSGLVDADVPFFHQSIQKAFDASMQRMLVPSIDGQDDVTNGRTIGLLPQDFHDRGFGLSDLFHLVGRLGSVRCGLPGYWNRPLSCNVHENIMQHA